jgi:hypothetical protein
MSLEHVIHRIATDAAFASAVGEDLEGALAREGIELPAEQRSALRAALAGSKGLGDLMGTALDPYIWHAPQFGPQTT